MQRKSTIVIYVKSEWVRRREISEKMGEGEGVVNVNGGDDAKNVQSRGAEKRGKEEASRKRRRGSRDCKTKRAG